MSTPLSLILIGLFAVLCFGATVFMPWAELGLPAVEPFTSIKQSILGMYSGVQQSPNLQYYVYSLFLAFALIAAAIGINVIGREDAEEKTVLPVKK